ncbi:uncharacterized protein LOC109860111 [Pseudomyrmex gracilis]|uniref:uncharacterized protein LOC109860111 n=1 Tax=Pseudomyrmex gracilis TaxID=219809 RepID=UPI0009949A06|nr:uncharacterized protein LOC109860111 [Pseudomyrmex gracilis]
MWRNFGRTAILATWTIFLILNSGLGGERIFNNLRISDERTSYKIQRTMSPAFDGKTTDRFALQRIKEGFKSNDRSSMRAKAVSPKCKNTENSNLRLSDCEKSNAVMSNAVTAPKHFKDSDGKNVRSTTEETATKKARLSKLIAVKKLRNTRNYRKFGSNAAVSYSPKLKEAEMRHKKITTHVFSSKRKRAIRRDVRKKFDGKKKIEWWKRREKRRIDNKYGPIAFRFPDEFPRRSPSENNDPDVRKNLDSSKKQFETMENTEFRKVNAMRERNKNEGVSQSFESMRNGANNKLTYAKNESKTLKITLPSRSSLKGDQNRENVEAIMSVTDSAIAEDSTYDRSANVAWTTLIADFEISNANGEVVDDENAISSYHFSKDEDPRSYKPLNEFQTIIAYKLRGGYSKSGFKVKYSDVRGNRKENENNVNSIAIRVENPRGIRLTGTGIRFAERSRTREDALARDTSVGSRRAYVSSNNIRGEAKTNSETENLSGSRPRRRDAEKMITDVDYATRDRPPRADERDPLSSLSTGKINETKLDTYTERISVTRDKNPMHVQHVELDADCERSRTTDFEAEVRGVLRTSLRNVSGLSSMSKFGIDLSARKNHNRVKYSANFDPIDITEPTRRATATRSDEKSRLDEEDESAKTSIVSKFASSDVTNVSDDLGGVRKKINEFKQFANTFTTNTFKLENVRDKSTSRRGNHRGVREGSKIYSPNGGVEHVAIESVD